VGARPRDIFVLLMMEGAGITLLGALFGVGLTSALIGIAGPFVLAHYGLTLSPVSIGRSELLLLVIVVTTGLIASLLPGYRAYRMLLADGLTPRT